ncbi:MAG: selenide, water dikinase SelD [Pseudomonadota bacterium]
MTPTPLTRDLVLIGGGHAHALVLRQLGMRPVAGLAVTVINPGPTAPYTGMLPGHIAGHYPREALEIDLYRLARFAQGRLLVDRAVAIDRDAKTVDLASGRTIAYDIASLDIGVTSDLPALPGFSEHGVAAKPLGPLAARWRDFLAEGGADRAAVIGGGVAGVELAFAMAHRLRQTRADARVTLLERATAMSALKPATARRLRARLEPGGVDLLEDVAVESIAGEEVLLNGHAPIRSAFTVSAAGARPFPWLAETGLDLSGGYAAVDQYFRTSDPAIFAVGDCAHFAPDPRPKAGVYAVRAAPVLYQNLVAAVAGGPKRSFRPQRDYLKLISLGRKDAIGERSGLAVSGPWVWRWKDRIDRAFMEKLDALRPMATPQLKGPVAHGVREELSGAPRLCGGCGAKVGPGALAAALDKLPPAQDVSRPIGDDAAIFEIGGARQILTTDHLPAFTGDPYPMARIAALHAMGDIWAMGAKPELALAQITLPRMAAALQTRWLDEILAAAGATFAEAGAEIAGGHTSQGPALAIGFTVTGRAEGAPITLAGAKVGDALLLTRPIGSGVLLAADMDLAAKGDDLAALFATLTTSQGDAAALLGEAHAMTDVTGFGLAGHLRNMLAACGVGAEIDLGAIPVFAGAERAASNGQRSSLLAANRSGVPELQATGPRADLLFDPQTAGGLLAALPEERARDLIAELHRRGHRSAAVIGRITDQPGRIDIL